MKAGDGLRVTIPFLPPSSNNIYNNIPGRGRRLSTAATQFQLRSMRIIQQEGRAALLRLDQDVPYELNFTFYFVAVENAGWYKIRTTRGGIVEKYASARFKRMDLSNRIKLLEDVVAKALGLDDSHTFRLTVEKRCDPKNPRVEVSLTRLPDVYHEGVKEDDPQSGLQKAEQHRADSNLPKSRVTACPPRDQVGGAHQAPARGAYGRLLHARSR